MRAVVQRVSSASVTIDHTITAQIDRGLLVLLGIQQSDTPADVEWLATKIANLRIFSDADGKMNLSLLDLNQPQIGVQPDAAPVDSPAPVNARATALVVSQFTLIASTRKGNRPSFNDAARPSEAIPLYEAFLANLGNLLGRPVARGTFGAMMEVALINDGPVTIVLDSKLRE